ncbi:Abhydrolase_3 domain-containing protein, partial [Cephalotus follicularis]
RKRRMASTTLDSSFSLQIDKDHIQHGVVVEEIDGLIRVYEDGHVERPQIVPCVTCSLPPELGVTSQDIVIDNFTSIWARFYVPFCYGTNQKLPLLVYFHGGGFCVGSAAWSCYHEFLAKLAAKSGCLIMSVNYRLAPENPLPAAYDDGLNSLMWLKQQALCGASDQWWTRQCKFTNIFLAGDSAGANLAYNLCARLGSKNECEATCLKPLTLKGAILVQPFFSGEARTNSEQYMMPSPRSVLNLTASDTYWRLALPWEANRDHPWCNPLTKAGLMEMEDLRLLPIMVCISEMDILYDRNLEFCDALSRGGKRVKSVVYKDVGHAFQVLGKTQLSQIRSVDMMAHIKDFIMEKS